MRYSTLVPVVVLIGYSLSCVSHGHNQQPGNSRLEEVTTVLRSVPAVLNEETHPSVHGIETKIKGNAGRLFEFKRAQFIDEKHGWAMSEHSFYRTIDGGKTWERLPQEPEKDARFTAFFFVDASRGWLTAVKHAFSERYLLGYSSVIMATEDGGRSWKQQASFPNEVKITDIRFLNKTEGLAVGGQGVDIRPQPYDEMLVFKTSNGGDEWNNISEAARTAIKNENELRGDSGKHIEWIQSSVLLLTRHGTIIRSTDGGKTWKLIARFKRELPHGVVLSAGYIKTVLDAQQRIRLVTVGHGGDYVGDFVAQEDGGWRSYEMNLTPLRDAVFLSDKEVLACGANLRRVDEKPNPRLKDAGVILFSFDTGKSWQTIYRSKSYETFFFLTKVKDNEFYAVSDTGTFLRFSLTQ